MNTNPPLSIDQYFVEEIQVKANQAYREPKNGNPQATLTASISIKRKGKLSRFMITIGLEVNKSEVTFKANPYYIALKITGYFSFIEGTDEQTIERMIGLNGPTILYGIARGIVAQATANFIHGKFILPTVNFVEATQKQAERKVSKSKSNKNKH